MRKVNMCRRRLYVWQIREVATKYIETFPCFVIPFNIVGCVRYRIQITLKRQKGLGSSEPGGLYKGQFCSMTGPGVPIHYIDWLDTTIQWAITDGHRAGALGKWMSANVMITTLQFKFREVCETLNENSLCWPNWGFPLGRSENHQGRGSVCECYGWDQGTHSLILWVIARPSWIKSIPYGKNPHRGTWEAGECLQILWLGPRDTLIARPSWMKSSVGVPYGKNPHRGGWDEDGRGVSVCECYGWHT